MGILDEAAAAAVAVVWARLGGFSEVSGVASAAEAAAVARAEAWVGTALWVAAAAAVATWADRVAGAVYRVALEVVMETAAVVWERAAGMGAPSARSAAHWWSARFPRSQLPLPLQARQQQPPLRGLLHQCRDCASFAGNETFDRLHLY